VRRRRGGAAEPGRAADVWGDRRGATARDPPRAVGAPLSRPAPADRIWSGRDWLATLRT